MELQKLLVESKEAWVEFPGLKGFEILLRNLSRKEMVKIREACTVKRWDKKVRGLVEDLDDSLFTRTFCEKTILDWKGLTLEGVSHLVLMDTTGQDLEQEVHFNLDNAMILVENSVEFDQWLNDVVFDIDNFRS